MVPEPCPSAALNPAIYGSVLQSEESMDYTSANCRILKISVYSSPCLFRVVVIEPTE